MKPSGCILHKSQCCHLSVVDEGRAHVSAQPKFWSGWSRYLARRLWVPQSARSSSIIPRSGSGWVSPTYVYCTVRDLICNWSIHSIKFVIRHHDCFWNHFRSTDEGAGIEGIDIFRIEDIKWKSNREIKKRARGGRRISEKSSRNQGDCRSMKLRGNSITYVARHHLLLSQACDPKQAVTPAGAPHVSSLCAHRGFGRLLKRLESFRKIRYSWSIFCIQKFGVNFPLRNFLKRSDYDG